MVNSCYANFVVICLASNLNFAMQDSRSQQPTSKHLANYDIKTRTILKLPPGCYESMQRYVNDTKHDSNSVLASQGICPDGLTVHEFYAFASLRSGHRLQWLNIARELASRTLDFGKDAVFLLFLQASLEAGPSALQQVSRDSHIDLEEEEFGHDLLTTLKENLTAVESNWQGSTAALTFISLATRLLSVSLHVSVRDRSLRFLQKARGITIKWVRDVIKLLHNTSDETEVAYLTLQALDLALICHSTFDLDPRQLPVLLSSSIEVAILVESATVVRDRWPLSEELLPTMTRGLLHRFSRTSHALEPILKTQVLSSSKGINQAVKQMWPGYQSGTPWTIVEEPDDRWLMSHTAASETGISATVHFNTLTGSLLINGKPLSRLPANYEVHPTYQRLFGKKILEIVPSTKGMYFETRNAVEGFQVSDMYSFFLYVLFA